MAEAINDISYALVAELLEYSPEIGGSCLVWKDDLQCHKRRSKRAGSLKLDGYYRIQIKGRSYAAHRLVWLLHNKEWPKSDIDHIDRNKGNNKIENLREATKSENSQNCGKSLSNSSGHTGVVWNKQNKKWQAQIRVPGRCVYLGSFDDIEKAVLVRLSAKRKLHTFIIGD